MEVEIISIFLSKSCIVFNRNQCVCRRSDYSVSTNDRRSNCHSKAFGPILPHSHKCNLSIEPSHTMHLPCENHTAISHGWLVLKIQILCGRSQKETPWFDKKEVYFFFYFNFYLAYNSLYVRLRFIFHALFPS